MPPPHARIRDTFALGEIQRGDDGQLSQLRYNASGSNVLGAETNLGWQPSPQWRLTAGASWYRSRFREPQRIFDDTGDGGDTVIESRDYLKTRAGPAWPSSAGCRPSRGRPSSRCATPARCRC
jgi:outer membrane receptor for ferrienterochelin and colicins